MSRRDGGATGGRGIGAWQGRVALVRCRSVNTWLRFLIIANAAVWFGSAIFFTFAVGPAFFSQESKALFQGAYPYYSGAVAQLVLERFFACQQVCGCIALALLVVDKFYTNRPLDRALGWLVAALLGVSLVSGFWLLPHMKKLHTTKYAQLSTPAQREFAETRFRRWHGASQVGNLFVLFGLLVYLRRVTTPAETQRFLDTRNVTS